MRFDPLDRFILINNIPTSSATYLGISFLNNLKILCTDSKISISNLVSSDYFFNLEMMITIR